MSNGPQLSSSLWLKTTIAKTRWGGGGLSPTSSKGSRTYQMWRHLRRAMSTLLSGDFTWEPGWHEQSGKKEDPKITLGNLWDGKERKAAGPGWRGNANSSYTAWGRWTPTSPSHLGKGDGLWGSLSTGNTAGFQAFKLEKKELHMGFGVDIGLGTSFPTSPCGVKCSFLTIPWTNYL